MLSEKSRIALVLQLFDVRCFRFPGPGEPGFRLAVHDRHPDIPLPRAPAYFDIRILISHPDVLHRLAELMYAEWREGFARVQRLSDIPSGSTPLVTALSQKTRIPTISPRLVEKTYDMPRAIDGTYRSGERVALIDDVVSEAAVSKRKALAILRDEGLEVAFIGVVMDNRFQRGDPVEDVAVHSLLGWGESFLALHEAGRISRETRDQCVAYPRMLADELVKHGVER